ncbi:hypothetical protein GCM10023094_42250 [Rhodococcus olei]|uniref:Uncharacterized protein n=1 Tax=Rhodococcus olei TaxID=2161675 RepID=A0ABP8PHF1_9NOCA
MGSIETLPIALLTGVLGVAPVAESFIGSTTGDHFIGSTV